MSEAPASSRLGWAALSAVLLLAACQATIVPATPTIAPSAPPTSDGIAPIGATQQATVTNITDGDTIRVEIGGQEFRVRYIGIDAPEIAHDNNPGEPLGAEASQTNADLVLGQIVILEKDTSDTDQFGRLLRYVWLGGPGTWDLVNEELAAQGLADVRSYPPDTYWQDHLQQAEDNAREADLGIWAN